MLGKVMERSVYFGKNVPSTLPVEAAYGVKSACVGIYSSPLSC